MVLPSQSGGGGGGGGGGGATIVLIVILLLIVGGSIGLYYYLNRKTTCTSDMQCDPTKCERCDTANSVCAVVTSPTGCCVDSTTCAASTLGAVCTAAHVCGCGTDADCAKAGTGATCVAQKCVVPIPDNSVAAGGTCVTTSQCTSGLACTDGKCVATTIPDNSVAAGGTCVTTSQCASGLVCTDGKCGGVTTPNGSVALDGACATQAQCQTGLTCTSESLCKRKTDWNCVAGIFVPTRITADGKVQCAANAAKTECLWNDNLASCKTALASTPATTDVTATCDATSQATPTHFCGRVAAYWKL